MVKERPSLFCCLETSTIIEYNFGLRTHFPVSLCESALVLCQCLTHSAIQVGYFIYSKGLRTCPAEEHHPIMDSSLIITNMTHPLHHLRSVSVEDLPPNDRACHVCATPWGVPKDGNGSVEHPVILPCGCIAGSSCLERSLETSPRCPLCKTTMRIIPGVNARLDPRASSAHLRELERKTGVNDWPIPSVEGRPDHPPDDAAEECAEQQRYDLQDKLGVLNGCHGTFLSIRELEVCISLVDYRLGTETSTADLLDAFIKHPLFDPSHWNNWNKLTADVRAGNIGKMKDRRQMSSGFVEKAYMNDMIVVFNTRAGTAILLAELELVVALMNFVHRSRVELRDVLLGVGNGGLRGRVQPVEEELVPAFEALDMRVGSKNAVEDLGDVFSQATV